MPGVRGEPSLVRVQCKDFPKQPHFLLVACVFMRYSLCIFIQSSQMALIRSADFRLSVKCWNL